MSSKGKRIGVIVVSVIAVIVGLMVAIPFLFKDKIKEIALNEVNKQLTADVGFDKIKISLIKNFPNASRHGMNVLLAEADVPYEQ